MNYALALVGWVLPHAAWQVCALALALAACLRVMRGVSAAVRYRSAAWCLVAALAAVALTVLAAHASVTAALARDAWRLHHVGSPAVRDRSLPWLRAAAIAWLGGTAVAQVGLAIQWMRLRRFLRRSRPAPALESVVRELSRAMGLAAAPEVRFAAVRTPMAAGTHPAFLLLPDSFGETWPPDEQRALLAHELAHIHRRDYSANLWRLGAASLLWWHPAAWVICARIRHEAECSTDECAVRFTGSLLPLARALVRLAGGDAPVPAMGAQAGCLSDRIARLAGVDRNAGREAASRWLPAALSALACAMATAGAAASHRDALTRACAASPAGSSKVITIRAHDPAGMFQVRMVRGRVTAIDLGDVRVPASQVLQTGETVRVVGRDGGEVLRLEVDARGGLRWQARRP